MSLEYFPWYNSYFKKCEKLTDQELGRLVRALSTYSITGERQELAGRESIAFDFIADDIDRAKEAYSDKCEKNKKNIESRYERIRTNTDVYERIPPNTNDTKAKAKAKANISPEIPNGISAPMEGAKHTKRFTPPSVEEVAAYCRERQNEVNAERFVDFYACKGWMVGKNPMKDWKAAVRTWEKGDDKSGATQSDTGSNQRLGIYL